MYRLPRSMCSGLLSSRKTLGNAMKSSGKEVDIGDRRDKYVDPTIGWAVQAAIDVLPR
jgi:hypothetical protein